VPVRSSASQQPRVYGGNSGVPLKHAPSSITISDHGVVTQVRHTPHIQSGSQQ
jgi:hypothetical protein